WRSSDRAGRKRRSRGTASRDLQRPVIHGTVYGMSPLVLAASSFMEIRPGLIFWTIVTFIIVAIVLRLTAWKPILDLVSEREKQIEDSIQAAKRERAEADKLLA